IAGKLIETPDSTVVEPTDPNGNYTIKPGAFVGFDHSTTELQGGEMLVASPDGQNKIPKLSPDGQFLFNNNDGDNMWTLIKPKISTNTDPFAVTIVQSGTYDGLTTSGYYEISTSSVTGGPSIEAGMLKVIDANGEIITQTMHTVSDAVWIRNKHNGAWTAWRQISL
ncbi:pyocin knob domain-containing protein, partial [Limosilactobacillus fermentum]|uniref:pyocin knob domain-containing protein n=1 Tax=Limosilactobacillus fermentum TaxID=1613 RepID=UPI002F26CC2A